MYSIYFLIAEDRSRTYVGFTENLEQRMAEHRSGKTKTTQNFGNFQTIILEKATLHKEARQKEKYWKSAAGRKKLKNIFNTGPSSSGQDSGFSIR